MNANLSAPFHSASQIHPDRLAIADEKQTLTYRQAAGLAAAISDALGPAGRQGARVAILATRSAEARLAVLGACWSGAAYVPLNLKLPEPRLIALLRASHFDAMVCDANGEALLTDALREAAPERILLADRDPKAQNHTGLWRLASPVTPPEPTPMQTDDLGYIEYTSGTTGAPTGVMITTGGVAAYVRDMQREYALTPDDRVAETADLSFDISVSNMFVTWNAGASLHILNAAAMFSLVKFVRRHELTVWYSVPSVIPLLQKTKALTPACMPSLRLTFFAGEPLPVAAAEAWRAAAPNSRVENLYGPTEATVVCLRQRVETSVRATAERGIVAIGKPFQGARAAILDENLRFAKPGEKGEIALAGPPGLGCARAYAHGSSHACARERASAHQ